MLLLLEIEMLLLLLLLMMMMMMMMVRMTEIMKWTMMILGRYRRRKRDRDLQEELLVRLLTPDFLLLASRGDFPIIPALPGNITH